MTDGVHVRIPSDAVWIERHLLDTSLQYQPLFNCGGKVDCFLLLTCHHATLLANGLTLCLVIMERYQFIMERPISNITAPLVVVWLVAIGNLFGLKT